MKTEGRGEKKKEKVGRGREGSWVGGRVGWKIPVCCVYVVYEICSLYTNKIILCSFIKMVKYAFMSPE